jgi:hypothetical protein
MEQVFLDTIKLGEQAYKDVLTKKQFKHIAKSLT